MLINANSNTTKNLQLKTKTYGCIPTLKVYQTGTYLAKF